MMNFTGFRGRLLASTAAFGAFALAAPAAQADILVSDLAFPNSALSGTTGPFGTVTIDRTGQVANVTFASDPGFLFIDSSAADLNVNSSNFAVTNITLSGPGTAGFLAPSLVSSTIGAGQQVDGMGKFDYTLTMFDGFKNAADEISFTITNSGTAWSSVADVLAFNANGFDAAAHIAVCNSGTSCIQADGATVTGFAGETKFKTTGNTKPFTTPPVPEPGTLALFGSAVVGLALLNRRRRSQG